MLPRFLRILGESNGDIYVGGAVYYTAGEQGIGGASREGVERAGGGG